MKPIKTFDIMQNGTLSYYSISLNYWLVEHCNYLLMYLIHYVLLKPLLKTFAYSNLKYSINS